MKDSATKEFVQGYNAQAAVAAEVTIQSNDKKQLEPMLATVKENCNAVPKELSADAGYYSEENIALAQAKGIHTLIPPGNTRPTDVKSISPRGRIPKQLSVKKGWNDFCEPGRVGRRTRREKNPSNPYLARSRKHEASGDSCSPVSTR